MKKEVYFMANIYVKFDTPEELAKQAEEALETAQEKEIPYVYLPTKEQVGGAAGLTVGTASACIVDAGDAEAAVSEIVEKVAELKE